MQMWMGQLALGFAAGVMALCANADAPLNKEQVDQIRSRLEMPQRGLLVESVTASEVPDLYAVQFTGGQVVYATANGEYFVVGDLHKVADGNFINLTEKGRGEQRAEKLASIPREQMIIFAPEGETRATLTVFTDVTCFYCQKFHLEVPALNKQGVEVRYLAWPREGVGSKAYQLAETAWCADNKQDTLTRLKAKQNVPVKVCAKNPVAAQFQLGQELGVTGTPALILQDGSMIPGYQPADQLLAALGLK